MKVMGLRNSMFILSYYLTEFIIWIIPTFGIILCAKTLFLFNTSTSVLVIVWYLNAICNTPFAFIFNSVFNHPRIARSAISLFQSLLMIV